MGGGNGHKAVGKGSLMESNKKAMTIQNGGVKENGHSILSSVSKIASQIKKPPHRRSGSPLIWFPRKKTDSFLKRKIKLLQEDGGMNLSLDETLGNANPHYTRIAREKIAAREAATKAMEARKAAMVEASWCRILQAARIQSKEAKIELEKAEKCAAEALEAAKAKGVMMYDRPDCPRRPCEVESFSSTGGDSTHTVTASFETAFEVDKEVMAAVKKAFIQLANCPSSSNREEFKDLLWKISQNPDISDTDRGSPDTTSECESCLDEGENVTNQTNNCRHLLTGSEDNVSESFVELVNTMLHRIKGLQEDELASLATIVATCGLNAALLELEKSKDHGLDPVTSCTLDSTIRQGTSARRNSSAGYGTLNRKEPVLEVPSLDKILVKRVSKLEREVQEARNSRYQQTPGGSKVRASDNKVASSEFALDLGSVLVKHVSKLEKEIQEAKSQKNNTLMENGKISCQFGSMPCEKESKELGNSQGLPNYMQQPDLKLHTTAMSYPDKENVDSNTLMPSPVSTEEKHQAKESTECSPVKHISRIERAKLESREQAGLDEILVKSVHRLEREKILVLDQENEYALQRNQRKQESDITASESLDKILVKHVSRLEKERLALRSNETVLAVKKRDQKLQNIEGLDEILVKHQSKLEKAKLASAQKPVDNTARHNRKQVVDVSESLDEVLVKHQPGVEKAKSAAARQTDEYSIVSVDARREARQRELQEAWGGLSLGNAIRPHLSRLERDKAAWKKAEEEEGTQASET